MIIGHAHTAFTATNMDRSLQFYCDALGLAHAFSVKNEQGEPWIEYVKIAPKQYIELFHPTSTSNQQQTTDAHLTPGDPAKSQGFHHICLLVDDIQYVAATLAEKDIPIDVAPKRGIGKNWQMWTHDPDGNKIEFIQPDDDSEHAK
ncbi:VOC family protein [Paenalkalicoccus suaedae]|uniref:VOC family protein n=1 Tax=Paenalkalicoccus suaedae TaxID=2592382 RepID=A0A859FCY9_9BACI|nr:VOC family protein [Paenalkalicoccus suaedae]QKS70086.1 VOC family protein [Paenalkalicoccus suaedae]